MTEGLFFKEHVMKQSDIYDHMDLISDSQEILLWEFDIADLQRICESSTYSLPAEAALFKAFRTISESINKAVREKAFTVFIGDCGPQFELFGIAIGAKTPAKIIDIISSCFEDTALFAEMEYSRIPQVPLIPRFRYERGTVIEYTAETGFAGKLRKSDEITAGLEVRYRLYASAEGMDAKEKYCG